MTRSLLCPPVPANAPADAPTSSRVANVLLLLLLTVAGVGCAGADAGEQKRSESGTTFGARIVTTIADSTPLTRRFEDVSWQPVWSRGGQAEEQLLAVVAALLPHELGVVIVDQGTLELQSLDAASGRTHWKVGRKGGGPGEFQDIGDITMDSAGNTLAIDRLLGRLTTISPSGEPLASRSSDALHFAHAICALDDGRIAAVMMRPEAWLTLVRDSTTERTYTFPAELPRGAPEFVTTAYFARGESSGSCPLFTLFGYGIGAITGTAESLELQPYSQRLTQPEFKIETETAGSAPVSKVTLERGATASSRGSVWRDTVVLNFTGNGARHDRVLDLHDSSGRYLTTWRYPAEEIEFAVYANGMLYTLSNSTVAPQITAWRRINALTGAH